MITRSDLEKSRRWKFVCHVDGSDHFQNHYANETYPRLTCVVTRARRRRSKIQPSKHFYVDGTQVFGCRELLEKLNSPRLQVVGGTEAA